jgi:hypothetical protein
MSTAGRLAALGRLRAIVALSGDAEAAELLADLIDASLPSAERQRAALDERDAALIEVHRRGFSAAEIARLLSRYAGTSWTRDAVHDVCPQRLVGTPQEFCWRALKSRPHTISSRQISGILRKSAAVATSDDLADREQRREMDQCDSETKRVAACRRQ